MYTYSPIKKVRVKNFRNLGDVELSFEDSPIVTLVGENEAGKTSIIKAFAACALHANPRDQKDWIRDGTKMFGIEITLVDGTSVLRAKGGVGVNLYKITYPDGKTWEISKITEGLPEPVQKVMGLIEEPETGEFLHVRTYEDRLLFVTTPDSVNYKVMYNALKVEQLTKAIKIGSTDVNNLKADIGDNEGSLRTLQIQLNGTKVFDIEPLIGVRDSLKRQLQSLEHLESAASYTEKLEQYIENLGALALLDKFNVQSIDEIKASNLSRVSSLIETKAEMIRKLEVIKDAETLEDISVDNLKKIDAVREKISELERKKLEAGGLIYIDEAEEIDEGTVVRLQQLKTLSDKLSTLKRKADAIDTSGCTDVEDKQLKRIENISKVQAMFKDIREKSENLQKINDYVMQVENYLKQCGVAVETCPKCGEAVIFDLSKME